MDSDSPRFHTPRYPEKNFAGRENETTAPSSSQRKPSLEKSWEVIMDQVNLHDEGLLQGWKEDIDTLLVLTGLFSAVVTAFTVESYQWLTEAPEDITISLLRQISQQMHNGTIPPPEEFRVLPSDIRINTFWFLSLILALVDALFGLLCKQWLREHRKPTHTRTPSEALALRWLRHESLNKWRVPTILAALPILLEIALFLFLAGLLELLWSRHKVPFALAAAIVSSAVLFYLATTLIPSIDIIRQALQVTPELRKARVGRGPVPLNPSPAEFILTLPPMELICPYKSPQAWIAFKASRAIARLPAFTQILYFFSSKRKSLCTLLDAQRISVWKKWALHNTLNDLSNWSSVDLEVIQRSSIDLVPPYYELQAFRWLVMELQDSPAMIPHLQNVLETLPPHLTMPAVFDQWLFLPGREWRKEDVERVLRPNSSSDPLSDWGIEDHKTVFQLLFLDDDTMERKMVFDRMLHYNHVLINAGKLSARDYQGLDRVLESIWSRIVGASRRDIGFPVSFHQIDRLLDDQSTSDLGIHILGFYGRAINQSMTVGHYSLAFKLAEHIITLTPGSSFVQTQACCDLIDQAHRFMIREKVLVEALKDDVYRWTEATEIVRRGHNLPDGYFDLVPGYFPIPLPKLEELLSLLTTSTEPLLPLKSFLDSYKNHWWNASPDQRLLLLEIVSNHVLRYHHSESSEMNPFRDSCETQPSSTSPLVSSDGINFVTFIHEKVVRDPTFLRYERPTLDAWMTVLNVTRDKHGLSEDHFIPMRLCEGVTGLPQIGYSLQTGNFGTCFEDERNEVAKMSCTRIANAADDNV